MVEERQTYIESISLSIKHISEEILQKSVSRRQFHNAMQQRVTDLANNFNLKGLSEYRISNIRANGINGLIDVVWLANSNPVVAFEIDSSRRIKSIEKLLTIEVSFRFWVYYGCKDHTYLIRKYDLGNLIQVIRLQTAKFYRDQK